jgi:hypothetical protein
LTDVILGRPARIARVLVVAGFVLTLGGCGTLSVSLPFVGPVSAEEAFRPRKLRFRREVGPPDRYQAKYNIRYRNDLLIDETITAELSYYSAGKEKGPPVRDQVIIWKQEEKRNLLEVRPKASNERRVVRKDHARKMQPIITPNTQAVAGRRGYRFVRINELGQIARSTATPFHFVYYDSLCYFWPVLPKYEVRPGDRWAWDMPVVVGREFSNNLMSLHAHFHFVEMGRLRGRGGANGPLVAVLDYTYYGSLDTGDPLDAAKVPPNTPGLLWRRNAVEGEGRAYLDVERGRIIWKREKYSAVIEHKTASVTRKEDEGSDESSPQGEAGVDYHRTENMVEFVARLLAPGEVATARPSRAR